MECDGLYWQARYKMVKRATRWSNALRAAQRAPRVAQRALHAAHSLARLASLCCALLAHLVISVVGCLQRHEHENEG